MNLRRIIGRIIIHNCEECGICIDKSFKIKFKNRNNSENYHFNHDKK